MSLRINPASHPDGLYWQLSREHQKVVTPITTGWFVSYPLANGSKLSIGQVSFLLKKQQIVVVRPLNSSHFDTSGWLRLPFDQVQSAGHRMLKLRNQAIAGTGTRIVYLVVLLDLTGAIKRQEGWLTVTREHPHTRAWSQASRKTSQLASFSL